MLSYRHALLALFLVSSTVPSFAAGERWVGSWGFANNGDRNNATPTQRPGTFRYRIRLSQGGDAVRLTFSNIEGALPLDIGAVTIAAAGVGADETIDAATLEPVSFSRKPAIVVPGGRAIVSDPVNMPVQAGGEVIVSVFLRTPSRPTETSPGVPAWFAEDMDATRGAAATWQAANSRPFLSLVAVRNPEARCTVVALGDSITDGYGSASPTIRGWPARLAARWQQRPARQRCAMVNMGIGGNRVLNDGAGTAAIDRFWRDVASVPGVTDVILLEGINDIGGSSKAAPLTSEELIAGYRQIIARARSLGLRIHGATLTPALGSGYMSAAKEVIRQEANDFIRKGGEFDGVIDFDAAVRDPEAPSKLQARFDPGDHLHPNDAGYQAMANAVDLRAFDASR